MVAEGFKGPAACGFTARFKRVCTMQTDRLSSYLATRVTGEPPTASMVMPALPVGFFGIVAGRPAFFCFSFE